MNYLLTPLHEHYDLGFGATGTAFKEAADGLLVANEAKGRSVSHVKLPINFLYRHSIELHLKSAIVVFHRRLKLPYGSEPFDADPMVLVGSQWKPFKRVHGIGDLWAYVNRCFTTHAAWLSQNTRTRWQFDPSHHEDVRTIDGSDPRSTFFRYPTTDDLSADVGKSSMKEFGDLAELAQAGPPEKVFAFIVENDAREFVKGYRYDEGANSVPGEALQRIASLLDGVHVALRMELCGGW